MWAVWLRVRAGLRQDWRGLVVVAVIAALMGGVALAALAGARRTDTAVPRFLQYAGPTEGQVTADPRTMDKIAALPGVAYTARGGLMLAIPVTADGRLAAALGQVLTWALIRSPPQERAIIVAGRRAVVSRAGEVMINETAARILKARVGSVIFLRGYRPDQAGQVLNGAVLRPGVVLPAVRVTGIIRTPTDLTENPDVPADISFMGTGAIYATAAFYHRFAASVANQSGLSVHLKRVAAGLAPFEAQVKRVAGDHVQIQPGSDAAAGQQWTGPRARPVPGAAPVG